MLVKKFWLISCAAEGSANGRVVFDMFNLYNKSEKARNIALSNLKRMMLASGKAEADLKFETPTAALAAVLTCRCNLGVKVVVDSYGEKSVVAAYKALVDAVAPVVAPNDVPF